MPEGHLTFTSYHIKWRKVLFSAGKTGMCLRWIVKVNYSLLYLEMTIHIIPTSSQ